MQIKRNKVFTLLHSSQAVLVLMTALVSPLSYATNSFSAIYQPLLKGRTFVTIGAGPSFTSDVGNPKQFPVVNPATDSFYTYTANKPSQTKATLNIFVGSEYSLPSALLLQAGLSYNQAGNLRASGNLTQGADIPSQDFFTYRYSVIARQLLAEGRLLYRYKNKFFPYFLLGLGASFNKSYGYSTNVPPFYTFTREYNSNSQTAFSYSLGTGIDMDITPHLRAGLGYRFSDLGKFKLGNATVNNIPVNGTLSQTHLYTNEVLAQLTWLVK